MDRRSFIVRSSLLTGGMVALPSLATYAVHPSNVTDAGFYELFKNPDAKYHPFIRWWWVGNKVEPKELIRELHLMKEAGICGVEINPIGFPRDTDDLGIRSLDWLSDEWLEMLQITFDEAKKLDMTCDLIVGSGFPFGGEFLQGDERAQTMVIGVEKLEGPLQYETSVFNLIKEADPSISNAYPGRIPNLISLKLVPDPVSDMSQVIDLSDKIGTKEVFTVDIPQGKHALYALVRFDQFASVILGGPGAKGPTLNHLNKAAVEKYLTRMSGAIEKKTGPLSKNIRSLFTDSAELEGANWIKDWPEVFKKRNGYDIMPYFPFTMWKTGGMGNVLDYKYGAEQEPDFKEMIDRMRYDVEVTKAEMYRDRFSIPYVEWCRKLGVKSRAQAYGRGFFPLESSMLYDIPENESWTTNYLRYHVGEEMSTEHYQRGRAYTMINKYVTSGARLAGKRLISAEEMTNTGYLFNTTLETYKVGCDQNAVVGTTHSIFHGFTYCPPETSFPGWIRYGEYYNERNNFWPYLKYFTKYRARVSSLLQHADLYADIAVLPPVADMWTTMGMQNEPWPSAINVEYQTFLWEAMCKCGNGTDYVSEPVIRDSKVVKGRLTYGKRSYSSLFLIEVESMEPATLDKLIEFVSAGGRVFCIEKYPHKSLGRNNYKERDRQVTERVAKLKSYTERFVLLQKPSDNDFVAWYPDIQKKYKLTPFVSVADPNAYVMVSRYIRDDQSEIFLFINSNLTKAHQTKITFPKEVTSGKYPWVWDLNNGERYRIELDSRGGFDLYLCPADSRIIVFDKEEKGPKWNPLPVTGKADRTLEGWDVEFRYSLENTVKTDKMYVLEDLKNTTWVDFSGTAVYRKKFSTENTKNVILNLGKVYGISILKVNGKDCGVTWYGDRIYDISDKLTSGENEVEVHVVTTMGNYMKTLKDNKAAQRYVNRKDREQRVESMGLAGPVTLYEI